MQLTVETLLDYKILAVGCWLAPMLFMVLRGVTLGALYPRIERRLAAVG